MCSGFCEVRHLRGGFFICTIIIMGTVKKILLVEDDVFLSSLLKNRFQKEGFEVLLAFDGDKALEILMTIENIDLILLDIILPKKTGFEILEEMRLDPQIQVKKTPVIIISNLGQEGDMERGKEFGVIEYLIKAKISIDDLVGKVKEYFSTSEKTENRL